MALKQYREAGRTAIIIAREEQNAGQYIGMEAQCLKIYLSEYETLIIELKFMKE